MGSELQQEREREVARLKEERHQARELKRKEEFVKQCRLDIEKRRLEVSDPSPVLSVCLHRASFPVYRKLGPNNEHHEAEQPADSADRSVYCREVVAVVLLQRASLQKQHAESPVRAVS